jgi:hypothetical protein
MATLAEFLKTGSLGPLVLGMDPVEVVGNLGNPEEESQKKNPLILKYGSLQLVFWSHGAKPQLRDISLNFLPEFKRLPNQVALSDFKPKGSATEKYFRTFVSKIKYPPVHIGKDTNGQQLVFLSGVVADFMNGLLNSIRITQKRQRETEQGALSDLREPSREQILEMIGESERALQFGSGRSALVMAWAALEATLRRIAIHRGLRGRIGVQPTILIRELISADVLSPEQSRTLEGFRQLRTSAVHGLAPVSIQPETISKMNAISKQLLNQNTRSTADQQSN